MPGLVTVEPSEALPQLMLEHETPTMAKAVHRFYASVGTMFEAWVARRQSPNTERAYWRDVLDLVEFLGLPTAFIDVNGKNRQTILPDHGWALPQVTVPQVQAWRGFLNSERHAAPDTSNRRVSSVSGLYKFMREAGPRRDCQSTFRTRPLPAHHQGCPGTGHPHRGIVRDAGSAAHGFAARRFGARLSGPCRA